MKRLICLTLLCLAAFRAEASLTASVDRAQLTAGESVELTLESDDPTLFGKPDLKPLDEQFVVLGTRQVNRLTTLNGKAQATTRWIITLQPRNEGKVEIPPILLGGNASEPISLEVLKAEDSDEGQKLAPVFIDASVDHEQSWVQAQVILTLRIYHSVSLYDDSSLSPLRMNDARVEPLGEPRTYEKNINGVRHGVIEVRYAIFPQNSGTLKIPGQTFNATQVAQRRNEDNNPFGPPPGKQVRVVSPSIPLQVDPKPTDYPKDAPWLPARSLSLTETWSPQPEEAKAGESLTRNIMLRVEGLSSAQLPPLPITLPEGLRHYPDQPQLANEASDQGMIGSREEREALIADKAGPVELPPVEIVWWNTQEHRVERTSLPARTLQVAANSQLEEHPESSAVASETVISDVLLWPWKLACALLSLTTLLGFTLWWRARSQPAVIRVAQAGPSTRTLLDELRRASQANDPHATRQALDAWARQQPETLADMAARFVPLSDALDGLNGALYSDSEGGRNWQGEDLWRAIRSLPGADPDAPPTPEASSLPPLYPR
ncbi:MAG: protein BatD [Pseudomonas sp.]|uniref:BatD family protein n=1 Tax=Pseudomonas sp. TaxID=306 RepID=UPI000CB619F6|nr:BatD family protein [Pseudomonas sp.]PJI49685.1 MAG: protein BatD [Pseudomonas sp.]